MKPVPVRIRLAFLLAALGFVSAGNGDDLKFDAHRGLISVKGAATGFFHLEEINGRSMLVTPAGHGYLALGVNHLRVLASPSYRDEPFTTEFDRDWKRFWKSHLGPRLEGWNVTSLGYGGPPELQDQLPYFATLGIAPIEKHRSSPDTANNNFFRFPDVFDTNWQKETAELVAQFAARHRDDPNLIGYLWTDTPTWSLLETRALRGTDWVTEVRRLPAEAPGRKAYAAFLQKRYEGRLESFNEAYGLELASLERLAAADLKLVPIGRHRVQEDDEAFLPEIARVYYRTAATALREADPNHLNFGDRYLAGDAPKGVLEAAAPYIDAVAVQPGDIYSRLYPPSTVFPEEAIEHLHQITGKPVLICDHAISFPTAEHPLTIFEQMPSEAEAVRATRDFLDAAFSKPYIIGYLRCQYVDRPAGFGRGLRQGLVLPDGAPRSPLVQAYRDGFAKVLRSLANP